MPLGALSLGIVAGLSVMVPMSVGAVKEFITGVAKMMGQMSFDWDAVKNSLLDAVRALDWANPDALFGTLGTKEYWLDLLRRCAEAAVGDTSSIAAQFETLVGETAGKLAASLAVGVFLSVLGGFVGYFVTRSLIRRDVAKRSVCKALLNGVIKTVANLTVLAFGAWLIAKVEKYAILAFLLTVVLYGAGSFLEAYLVQGYKNIPFKKVLQVKNFFELPLLTLIEFGLALGVYALIGAVLNELVGMYVAFAVFVITIVCVQLNAEAYVKSLVAAQEQSDADAHAMAAAYAALTRLHAQKGTHVSEAVAQEEDAVVEAVVEALSEGPAPVAEKQSAESEKRSPEKDGVPKE